ncbi:MAG: hypothetical protein NTW87_30565 [Planctomycetota bacterium]|nr:hypothetical protein [Planctomycetota bacterium]
MDQPPEIPEQIPAYTHYLPSGIVSLLGFAFWLWMCVDCYRRMGLNVWHYLFLFFWPSTLLYFVVHMRQIFRGSSGRGLFGGGLKSRITRAEQQLRVSDTLAARVELAELYFEAGQYEACETEYRKILAADAGNLEAAYYLALCRLQQNDAAGALGFLEQVMQGNRKLRFGVAWLRYTDALLAVGRRDEALEERRKLARAFPRPLTEFAYAQLLADAGQKEKARAVLEDMLATSHEAPAEDRVWLKQGKALVRQVT